MAVLRIASGEVRTTSCCPDCDRVGSIPAALEAGSCGSISAGLHLAKSNVSGSQVL